MRVQKSGRHLAFPQHIVRCLSPGNPHRGWARVRADRSLASWPITQIHGIALGPPPGTPRGMRGVFTHRHVQAGREHVLLECGPLQRPAEQVSADTGGRGRRPQRLESAPALEAAGSCRRKRNGSWRFVLSSAIDWITHLVHRDSFFQQTALNHLW